MKKLMVVVAAMGFAVGVYAADAVKPAAPVAAKPAVAAPAAAAVCADCAKLNVDKKADAAAKLCPACEAKKAAAAKAAAPVAKAPEAKK
jgi:hypothetical protein